MLAFAFLVTLFVGPVQMGTQVLTDAQNAIAGWRRVIGILDTPADVVDPGPDGADAAAAGRSTIDFDDVGFAYPGGPLVLRDVDLRSRPNTRVAVVGETGSGKTTFAKLLTRLMDPTSGAVRLDGVDLREVPFDVAARTRRAGAAGGLPVRLDAARPTSRYGKLDATDDEILAAVERARPDRLARGPAARPRHPRSASAASRCRRGSGSWSRWSARTSPTPTCWSSTRPPAPSTRRSRCGSAARWSG